MIKPPRTAVLAAVVATAVACKSKTGPGPDGPVGIVASPQPAPQPTPDAPPDAEPGPAEPEDVGTVAIPEEEVGTVAPEGPVGREASPRGDERLRRHAPPPSTDPKGR